MNQVENAVESTCNIYAKYKAITGVCVALIVGCILFCISTFELKNSFTFTNIKKNMGLKGEPRCEKVKACDADKNDCGFNCSFTALNNVNVDNYPSQHKLTKQSKVDLACTKNEKRCIRNSPFASIAFLTFIIGICIIFAACGFAYVIFNSRLFRTIFCTSEVISAFSE